jgi:hypothetical protein
MPPKKVAQRAIKRIAVTRPEGYIVETDSSILITVVELPTYERRILKLLSEDERQRIINHLAANPMSGDLVPGGGGIRKLRWGIAGRGKSGGIRLIHFFADTYTPVFLIDVFAKNEKANYSDAELAMVREMAKRLISSYRRTND